MWRANAVRVADISNVYSDLVHIRHAFFCSRADTNKGQGKSLWSSLLAKVDYSLNTWEVRRAAQMLLQLMQFRCVVTLVMPG